jgi:N-acyl-D-aspartate/D-glutamate deacylase
VAESQRSLANRFEGRQTLDVKGLVIAPDFIDLHAHGEELKSNQMQLRNGVTTALDKDGLNAFHKGC